MLNDELESNEIKISLNIEAVFVIALYIQNHIIGNNYNLTNIQFNNRRTEQKYIFDNQKYFFDTKNVLNPILAFATNIVDSIDAVINDNDDEATVDKKIDNIFNIYYDKAKELDDKSLGLYGTYWFYYNKNGNDEILNHIKTSKILKKILISLPIIETNNNKFNEPKYKLKIEIKENIKNLNILKKNIEKYLKFINNRFEKKEKYQNFLNKIYVHVLANIIGVDFYLVIKELIIKYYIGKGIIIDKSKNKIDKILNNFKELLINNKLDATNINFLYITEPIPESVLKNKIKEMFIQIIPDDNNELINTFETAVLPMYRDLYRITYKYLKMFMENYYKFIYNQYHGLNILLLLLDKISS